MPPDWTPTLSGNASPGYRDIADAITEDIARRRLLPGMRMPTHRHLAEKLGVSVGTVTRAYSEAKDRGVLSGEVGRGTFVNAVQRPAVSQRSNLAIDLTLNKPIVFDNRADLANALSRIAEWNDANQLLEYPGSAGDERARSAGQKLAEKAGLAVGTDQIVITNGAQQALLIALSTLTQPGDLVLTEELNYTGIRRMAEFLRLRLQGLPLDEHGALPDAFEDACRKNKVAAVILTPTIHNPTAATMPLERRIAIVKIAAAFGVPIVEDDVCGPLVPAPLRPLSSLAEHDCYYICSTSKCFAPGLRLGYLAAPTHMVGRATNALHATTFSVAALATEIVTLWLEDGTADTLIEAHRREIAERLLHAKQALAGFPFLTHPQSYHLWLKLPSEWRTHEFVAACASDGVNVSPSSAFAISPEYSPNAVRVSLGAEHNIERLKIGLERIARTLKTRPATNLSLV